MSLLRLARGCTGAILALWGAPLVNAQAAPPTVDANALVRQMVNSYQGVQSYKETSEARFYVKDGAEFIQTTQLAFKRPNLLLLQTFDAENGTMISDCNGQTITLYSGKSNVYVLQTAPATIALAVADLSKAALRLIDSPNTQVLSPLGFFTANGMPAEAKQFRFVRIETIEGHRTALVKADADLHWLRTLFPPSFTTTFQRRELALWIDLTTKLVVRTSCDIAWKAFSGNGMQASALRFTETHHNAVRNAPLRVEEFKVALPKGALEVYSEGR